MVNEGKLFYFEVPNEEVVVEGDADSDSGIDVYGWLPTDLVAR